MPKRETINKAEKLLNHEGEFFVFELKELSHIISQFNVINQKTQEPVIDEATGEPKKKEQLKLILQTECDGEVQELTEWVSNAIPAPGKKFDDRNKLYKIAKGFNILDEIYNQWAGFNIVTSDEVAAFKKMFIGKKAEGLIKIKNDGESPIVKIETWRVVKNQPVASGKRKAGF